MRAPARARSGDRVLEAVASTPEEPGADVSARATRRLPWLVRISLMELLEVAENVELRSQLLAHTVRFSSGGRRPEIGRLADLASDLREIAERLGREPSPDLPETG